MKISHLKRKQYEQNEVKLVLKIIKVKMLYLKKATRLSWRKMRNK